MTLKEGRKISLWPNGNGTALAIMGRGSLLEVQTVWRRELELPR